MGYRHRRVRGFPVLLAAVLAGGLTLGPAVLTDAADIHEKTIEAMENSAAQLWGPASAEAPEESGLEETQPSESELISEEESSGGGIEPEETQPLEEEPAPSQEETQICLPAETGSSEEAESTEESTRETDEGSSAAKESENGRETESSEQVSAQETAEGPETETCQEAESPEESESSEETKSPAESESSTETESAADFESPADSESAQETAGSEAISSEPEQTDSQPGTSGYPENTNSAPVSEETGESVESGAQQEEEPSEESYPEEDVPEGAAGQEPLQEQGLEKNQPTFFMEVPAQVILNENSQFSIRLVSSGAGEAGSVEISVNGTKSPDSENFALYSEDTCWQFRLQLEGNTLTPLTDRIELPAAEKDLQVAVRPVAKDRYAGTYTGYLNFSVRFLDGKLIND